MHDSGSVHCGLKKNCCSPPWQSKAACSKKNTGKISTNYLKSWALWKQRNVVFVVGSSKFYSFSALKTLWILKCTLIIPAAATCRALVNIMFSYITTQDICWKKNTGKKKWHSIDSFFPARYILPEEALTACYYFVSLQSIFMRVHFLY